MVKKFLLVSLLGLAFTAFSQKEGNNWYFGYFAGITFNTSPPSALTNSQMPAQDGCAAISTPSGRIMFYTQGVSIWDSTHSTMSNGTGLNGGIAPTQSGLIVPRPDSANRFFVFTVDNHAGSKGFCYSEVDMNLNNGKGAVISGTKNILLTKPTCEKMTSIKHSNGIDYWVLTHKYQTDTIYAYLITSTGINSTPVRSRTGIIINNNTTKGRGNMKVSPDGTKVAYVNVTLDSTVLADFNSTTGAVTNAWTVYNGGYGCEFSPKSNLLYVAESTTSKIYQYNAKATSKVAFRSSKKCIDSVFNNALFSLQLGPDGKMYIAENNSAYLHVIHAPDSAGFACRPEKKYIDLGSARVSLALPNFTYFQRRTFTCKRNCINDSTFFTITDLSRLDSVKWNFDDAGSGASNTSKKTTAVSHIYKTAGFYNVSLISFFKTDKDTAKVKIYVKNAKPNLGKDTAICNNSNFTLKPHKNYISYAWNTSSTASSINVTQKGTYILKAKDTVGCISSDTIVIKLPKVIAKFKLSDTLKCFNKNTFSVKDTSSFTDETRLKSTWYFGDGTSKVDTLATKIYATAGTYFIKLVLQSKLNCKDSISKKIVINPNASIAFSINKTNQCFKGHSYNFTNTSTISSGTLSYAWNFGDDSTSTLKDITGKTYRKDSFFRVKLITTSDKNCKDTLTKIVNVYPNPLVKFTESKTSQCFNNNTTNFTNGSTIHTGFLATYKWFFGDGNVSSSFHITKKKYTTADSFHVMLLHVSDKGCRDSLTKTIFVYPNTKIDFAINKLVQCSKGHSFDFTDSSKLSAGTFSYDWDLGDGMTSTQKNNYSKVYFIDSTYKVTLITTTDKNCKDTLIKTITIHPDPKAVFIVLKPFQCFNNNNSNFPNISTIPKGSIVSNIWDLGDSTTQTSKNITNKHYNKADSFYIKLLTISDKGCKDSITKSMLINPNTNIGFDIDKDTQCFEWHRFNFTNTSKISTGFINTYSWAFGDNSTAPFVDMKNKKYNSFGNYLVRLITGSDQSCMDTLVKRVVLHASPVASFTIDKDRQCFKGNVFNYINYTTINNGSIIRDNWDLGNGQKTTTQNISNLKYLTEDTFKVRLIPLSDQGCTDTMTKIVVTYAQPVVKFIVPNDSQCWQNNYFNIVNQTTLKYGKLNHVWNFGDATFDYTYKPLTKKYPNKSAAYTIRYIATSDHGCIDSAKHRIVLLERPVSDFIINDSIQCFKSHLFTFNNITTFSVMNTLTYYWNYGNGNNSVGINAQNATYPNAQYYNVRLISYSSLTNCYDTIIRKVLPAPHAIPDFAISLDSQCLRFNKFNFTNKSSITFGQMTYRWTFNDNTFSALKDPSKHYNNGTSYAVKLVTTTNHLCKDSVSKPIVLIPHPKANFTINDSTQCLNSHVFDFTNTTALPFGTYTSNWQFDDTTAQSTSKNHSGKQYKYASWHKVMLAVNSNYNCTDTILQTVYLEKSKSTGLKLIENDSQCQRWNRYSFSTTNNNPKVITASWNWDLGDGNTSTSANPVYHYLKEGPFNIMVQTISANGCKDTARTSVVLLPQAVLDFSSTSPCYPEPVIFKDLSTISTGKIISYEWEFGNSNSSFSQNPQFQYKYPGSYNITLITKSDQGCIDTILRPDGAKLREKPKAHFNFSRLPSRLPELINLHLSNESSSDVITNFWDLGNGFLSSDSDPNIEYSDTGRYRITLYVSNADQCKDTFSMETGMLFPDFFFFLPNSFSPLNSAGVNDQFMPSGSIYVSYFFMEIYNRWGEKVFETNDIRKGWDGTYKDEPCEQGTYLCKIYLVPINGKKQFHSTSITLMR